MLDISWLQAKVVVIVAVLVVGASKAVPTRAVMCAPGVEEESV